MTSVQIFAWVEGTLIFRIVRWGIVPAIVGCCDKEFSGSFHYFVWTFLIFWNNRKFMNKFVVFARRRQWGKSWENVKGFYGISMDIAMEHHLIYWKSRETVRALGL